MRMNTTYIYRRKIKLKGVTPKLGAVKLFSLSGGLSGHFNFFLGFVTLRTIKMDCCKILQCSTLHWKSSSRQRGLPLSELLPGWVADEPRCHRRRSADHPRNPSVRFLPPLLRLTWELCGGREGLGQPDQLPQLTRAPQAGARLTLTLSGPQKRARACHQSPG